MLSRGKIHPSVLEAVVGCTVIAAFIAMPFLFPGQIYSTFYALVGIWVLDVYFKKLLGYRNETAFADLSFSAFVIFAVQVANFFVSYPNGNSSIKGISPLIIGIITLSLGFIWILNLRLFRDFPTTNMDNRNETNAENSTGWTDPNNQIWITSIFLALISVLGALSPYFITRIQELAK